MTRPDEHDPWEFVDFDLDELPSGTSLLELAHAVETLTAEIVSLRLSADAHCDPPKSRATLLTAKEAALHLRLKPKALYQRVARGQIKTHRLGRALRFRRTDLDALLTSLAR
jgi:excisionase family DNA binding protein